MLKPLNLKLYKFQNCNMVHFRDVVKALIKRVMIKQKTEFKIKGKLNEKTRNQWQSKFKELKSQKKKKIGMRAEQDAAAGIIQQWFRNKKRDTKGVVTRNQGKKNISAKEKDDEFMVQS